MNIQPIVANINQYISFYVVKYWLKFNKAETSKPLALPIFSSWDILRVTPTLNECKLYPNAVQMKQMLSRPLTMMQELKWDQMILIELSGLKYEPKSAQAFVKFILVMYFSVRHDIYNYFLKHYKKWQE